MCVLLKPQKVHRDYEAEAPKTHDIQSRPKDIKPRSTQQQTVTTIAESFETSRVSSARALWGTQHLIQERMEISPQVPQGCASLNDLRIL
jgi:hypothetical protein